MYDHFIAVDWAQSNMAVARLSKESEKVRVFEGPTDLLGLKEYLSRLKGSKILTFEESTGAQWLYIELRSLVDKLVICDPYRNKLLSEGAKNDRIDAVKLAYLLRSNLLKEVFHSGDEIIYLRKVVSGYNDLVKAGVRLKNQRAALFRGVGKDHKKQNTLDINAEKFVLESLDRSLELYATEKKRYETEFKRLSKEHESIRIVKSLPGIGTVNAVKVAAYVVNPARFKSNGQFLSYCGLIKHDRISGGKLYGQKRPRCCTTLKQVFKTAVITAIPADRENPFKEYYNFLISEKKYAEHTARNAVARRIATLTYGVLKSGKEFEWYRRPQSEVKN